VTDGFRRYLRAKRSVDDRALDRRLFDRLCSGLRTAADAAPDGDGNGDPAPSTTGAASPLRVLEVGAGVGTMVERALEWELFPPGEIRYAAVDVDRSTVRAVPDRLAEWAGDRDGWTADADVAVEGAGDTEGRVRLAGPERTVVVRAVAAEAVEFVAETDRAWDLLIGAALLDLLPPDRLPSLLSALRPGGWWYFPITFDGGTRFAPDHGADRAVERAYHRHMDRKPGGTSRAGLAAIDRLGDKATVVGAAGSDWIVRPADVDTEFGTADTGPGTADGDAPAGSDYPGDERYFLGYVLDTVAEAVRSVDRAGIDLSDDRFDDWLAERRRQLAAGELVYATHQLDLLGRLGRQ
jgi:hypothetical protein